MHQLFAILALLFTAPTQTQTWTVQRFPNQLDKTYASFGDKCFVNIERDGRIRLGTSTRVYGFPDLVDHDIMLKPKGVTMVVEHQLWSTWHTTYDGVRLSVLISSYFHTDLFWENCSKALPLLPSDILAAFRGWGGLPRPSK